MVQKKNPKLDTRRYAGLFFNIGLVVSLGLVLMAFEWKTENVSSVVDDIDLRSFPEDVIIEPPPTEHIPPPKPVEVFNLIEKPDEEDIEPEDVVIEILFDDETKNEDPVFVEEDTEEEVDNTVYIFVQKQPTFMGKDQSAFVQYISSRIKYPPMARRMGIEGKVFAQFVIDKDGSMTNIQIIKGIGAGCDEEVLRVLNEAPSWEPGKQRGRPVKVQVVVPVSFTLNR